MAEEVVDATVVEEGEAAGGEGPEVPGELVARPGAGAVIQPLPLEQVREAMTQYQHGLQSLLTPEDWQNAGRGEKFVKKSGWRKIATWFGLSVELVRDEVERDPESGEVQRATVWARAIAPNGRSFDGDGHCSVEENRFKSGSGRQKLENDLRGTATTRAINRAISGLVGMGAVSAEEMDTGGSAPVDDEAPTETKSRLANALVYLLEDEKLAERVFKEIKEASPSKKITKATAAAVLATAVAFRERQEEGLDGTGAAEAQAEAEGKEGASSD